MQTYKKIPVLIFIADKPKEIYMEQITEKISGYSVLLLVIFFFVHKGHCQTDLIITFIDATEQGITIEPSGKIYFENVDLVIKKNEISDVLKFPIAVIRSIKYDQGTTSNYESDQENQIVLYPNPANASFMLKGDKTEAGFAVRIFSVNGQEVLRGKYRAEQGIDIGFLQPGVYTVIINDRSYKLIKN